MSEVILKVEGLCFSYKPGDEVLKNVTFSVHAGEILGILGPNGGGKSTLFKCITGQLMPQSGKITFFEEGLEIPRPAMTYLPQKDFANDSFPLTVHELLECARLPHALVPQEEITAALKRVSFEKSPQLMLRNLSGGEFQRVLLAKAYLSEAKLILMDEPTKGLDGVGQDNLLSLIQEFKKEKEAAILLIEHNIAQVLRHGDRLLCLNRTYHWHNERDQLEKNILEHTYHCEFEHLMIHETKGDILDHEHHACDHHHSNEEHSDQGEKE